MKHSSEGGVGDGEGVGGGGAGGVVGGGGWGWGLTRPLTPSPTRTCKFGPP